MRSFRGVRGSGLIALVLGSLSLAGCAVAPAPGYVVEGPVMVAPPPPRVEVIGVAPSPGLIWVGGYWNWVGGSHVWVAGHWEAPPRGYRVWVPHHWVAYRGGWRLVPGHWR